MRKPPFKLVDTLSTAHPPNLMPPLPVITFSGYAIIGLTLLILSVSIAVYLLRLKTKTRATRSLVAFFCMVALSGISTILANALVHWHSLFAPWQDFWILAGGVALTQFAYSFPHHERSREAKLVLLVASSLTLVALAYCIIFNYHFLFNWTPELDVSNTYYSLLPLGILLIVVIFVRRAVHFSALTVAANENKARHLLYPQGAAARAFRNLALALSLAFLPGLQTLLAFPFPYGLILSNIGSILAITTIALVYFNYAPEVDSFMAKLVGISLATVLLILAVLGTIDVYSANENYFHEIGLAEMDFAAYVSANVSQWLFFILASSAFVLLIFPLFFRRTLVKPLQSLTNGIRQVNEGKLDTAVSIQFNDEIGYLTHSFNRLTAALQASKARQEELIADLQRSQSELEERVADRTRELSTFADLTVLPSAQENVVDLLQPALDHIMHAGLCQALCVHLLKKDEDILYLAAQRNLPAEVALTLTTLPISAPFIAQIQREDDPLLLNQQRLHTPLPSELHIARYLNYLGAPLRAGDETHGWLSCYRPAEDDFTVGEISLLVALARQLGVIVENFQLRQRIQDVAVFEERQRLARDLHDSVTQLVYSMTLFTRSAQEAVEDNDRRRLQANLDRLANTSFQVLREMRFLLFELQPPSMQELGLAGALEMRLDMVERRVGIQADLALNAAAPRSPRVDQELYYVAIEALNNALKHAAAKHVKLTLEGENGTLYLRIADNGRGFDLQQVKQGLGMQNMRQRVAGLGGQLQINSAVNSGTQIIAIIPLTTPVDQGQ